MAITSLPTNPDVNTMEVGKNYLIYIDTSTTSGTTEWTLIGGQKSGSLKRTADEIDASCKTTGGWKSTLAGQRSWSMDLESVVVLSDKGKEALDYAFLNGAQVHVKIASETTGGETFYGWASVTDYSLDTPQDDVASISATLSGCGPLKTTEV